MRKYTMHPMPLSCGVVSLLLLLASFAADHAKAQAGFPSGASAALLNAYPTFLDRIEENDLVWKDSTRMHVDDGKGKKTFDEMLDHPDIKDMFSMKYPVGDKGLAPDVDFDPGRVRYMPLFEKMYGKCQTGGVAANLVDVTWLPKKDGGKLKFTKVNGAAEALQKASNELDNLPDRFVAYLRPSEGSYNCRQIAGANRQSPHGLGIAIDIAGAHSDYWRWSKPDSGGRISYKNEIPWDIVGIFEKYGFIWGGKWYHYDTMHFEYRPEIISAAK
jgi:hypothetical protein